MGDLIREYFQNDHDVPAKIAAGHLIAAFVFGVVIAIIHWAFRRHDDRPGGLGTTLVLLCVICSLVTVVIGGNLAKAFGLVGALSIVRFRTSVGDTRDTAFVIFSVAVGMALGSGYLTAATIAIPIFAGACLSIEFVSKRNGASSRLKVKVASAADADAALRDLLGKCLVRYQLRESALSRKTDGVDMSYRIWLVPGTEPATLIDAPRQRPGILKVAWAAR